MNSVPNTFREPGRAGRVGPRVTPSPGPTRERHPRERRRRIQSTTVAAFVFAAPLIAYLVVFYAYPLYRNVELSLHDYTPRAFVQGNPDFVGMANFVDVLSSNTFGPAVRNTILFTLISIVAQFAIGLALAVFFRTHFRLSGLLRALFLIPWLLPLIVSASTWSWMLNSENGIINAFLGAFGIGQINWLTSPEWALVSVIIANIWLGIPFNLVILYSGLQTISDDMYEAAALDGANAWQKFRRITFPLLRPVSTITLLLGLVYTLKVVDVIWIMTTGGPGNASTTLAIWSYRRAFGTGQPDFSEAAAVGNLLIIMALVGGFVYLYLQRRQENA
ncbi:sugar ABC transporter permease [Actinobacteria bacterium YIM 96077]|uniref:Sugar ABC transporter permease n=1 Tax=Phytoactinopolyspora halophila TaxID=1981511 RepID=A0A329QYE0_9ACTN|nr:sugar ABC transporter permease [Phytoactinopolyspora halophila]AYY13799.1 sugar ABC transporter permease [Actinobacteria bacterium YIM 96077]RAW15658.1 sugar ABC transporter permease [Phytoactinopolyspora halophila]